MENLLNTGESITYDGDQTLHVRRLNVTDVFKFAKLLGKVGKGAFSQVSSQFKMTQAHEESEELTVEERAGIEETKKAQAQEMGFTIFATLADFENDLLDFLAGVTDKSIEEFKLLPPDVALDIITLLAQGEDLKRFFDKARALSVKILPQQN